MPRLEVSFLWKLNMKKTCKEAYSIYLQHVGGDENANIVINIIKNCRPYGTGIYITSTQYVTLWCVIVKTIRQLNFTELQRMKILHAFTDVPIGQYDYTIFEKYSIPTLISVIVNV